MIVKLSQQEVEDLMVDVAKLLLDVPATNDTAVRIPYGASSKTGSAAAHSPQNSVCYVHVQPTDDGYGRQHHIRYENGAENDDDMIEVDEYTEEYAVIFSCYGPDSYDRARTIRDGLYGNAIHRILVKKNIHLKVGIPPLEQTHELMNTQWVKRCDVTATFYTYVRVERKNAVPFIEKVSITMKTDNKSLQYANTGARCGAKTKGV